MNKNNTKRFKGPTNQQLLWGLFFVAVATVLVLSVNRRMNLRFQGVDIKIERELKSNELITEKDVLEGLRKEIGFDIKLAQVNEVHVIEVEKWLRDNPFVNDAVVYVDGRNKLHMDIVQRHPMVRIMSRSGGYYLDQTGNRIPLSKNYTVRVPIATGHIAKYNADFLKEEKGQMYDLWMIAKAIRKDAFLRPLVSQIYVDKKMQYHLVPKVGEEKILLGSSEDLNEKLFDLKEFYKEGLPRVGWNKYAVLDLRNKDQVIGQKK